MVKKQTCANCIWFRQFQKRGDEPSGMGCGQWDWAGYVTDIGDMPCSGIAWSEMSGTITYDSPPKRSKNFERSGSFTIKHIRGTKNA